MFKQYNKTKTERIGIKLDEVANVEGILLDFLIYQENLKPHLVQPSGNNWL